MKKKISLFIICGIVLLGVCGCEKSIEDELLGKTFTYEEESKINAYGSAITIQEFSFIGNSKAKETVDIKFTGSFKNYGLNKDPGEYDVTYTIDGDIVTINSDNDKYVLRYDKNSKCLVNTEKEEVQFCQ